MTTATATPPKTPAPLIDRLTKELGYPLVDLGNIDAFLSSAELTVLFFTEDIKRFPESNDVAVVLPELLKAFPALAAGVVSHQDERKLQKQYGFMSWPALVFFRDGQYLGALTGIQDWNVYLEEINRLLAAKPTHPPTLGIPVVTQ